MNGDDYAPDWWYISDDYAPVEDNNGECDDFAADEDDRTEARTGVHDDDIDKHMMTNKMMACGTRTTTDKQRWTKYATSGDCSGGRQEVTACFSLWAKALQKTDGVQQETPSNKIRLD